MPISIIAAMAFPSRVIGNKAALPWSFSKDLAFFKEKTMGSTVIMGRTTYQSILARLKRPLPGRTSLVLTRDRNFLDDRVSIIYTENDVEAYRTSKSEVFIIGGSSLYRQFLPVTERIYLTRIMADFEGDTFFPSLDPEEFRLIEERSTQENGIVLNFDTLQRTASR